MTGKRPSWPYLPLFAAVLALWCLAGSGRWPAAILLWTTALFAYRVPQFVLKPTVPWVALWGGLILAFFQFLIFDQTPQRMLAIYDAGWVNSVGYTLAVLITLQWFCWRSRQFNWLLFSQGLLLMLAGITENTPAQREVFLVGLGIFCVLFLVSRLRHALQSSAQGVSRGGYWRRLLLFLLILGVTSTALIRSAEVADQRFNDMLNEWLIPDPRNWSGFSGVTRLQGGESIRLSEEIAFVIEGQYVPDYWRGNILTHYEEGTWTPEETLHAPLAYSALPSAFKPTASAPATLFYPVGGTLLPDVHQALPPQSELRALKVSMRDHFNGLLFFPKETVLVGLPAEAPVYQNRYGLLRRELRSPEHQFTLLLNAQNQLQALYDENLRRENLQVPPEVKRALLPLAHEITRHAQTDRERAARIESWFRHHFRYRLSIAPTAVGVDPTVDFVLRRKAAWCSWYASGMTLMLRSLGIPAHIVSGWRSMDYNPLARQWVVREKEAHDWVEILDADAQRWVSFDPTPPGQLAEVTGSGVSDPFYTETWVALKLWLARFQEVLDTWRLQDALNAFQRAAIELLRKPGFYLFLLVFLGLNQWLKRRKARPLIQQRAPLVYTDPEQRYAQAYQGLVNWQRQRELEQPVNQSLQQWFEAVQSQLEPDEYALLKPLVADVLAWRFQTRLSVDQKAEYAERVEKNIDQLLLLAQARKLRVKSQDIIGE